MLRTHCQCWDTFWCRNGSVSRFKVFPMVFSDGLMRYLQDTYFVQLTQSLLWTCPVMAQCLVPSYTTDMPTGIDITQMMIQIASFYKVVLKFVCRQQFWLKPFWLRIVRLNTRIAQRYKKQIRHHALERCGGHVEQESCGRNSCHLCGMINA